MADELRFLTQPHSHNFTKIPNFQCVIIILHDLFLICSFVASYPLYSSYFIFFSPYLIKIISFISPPFIAAVVLSLLLTTTTAFCPKLPQLELEILQTVIHELKSNLEDVNGADEECDFEDFEIYKFVFDATRSIVFRDEGVDLFEEEEKNLFLKEKVLEDSVHGGRRDDITTRCSIEEESSLWKLLPRRPEKDFPLKETFLEDSEHGGRRNDIPISELDIEKFEEENSLVKLISRRPEKNLSLKETVLEDSVHRGRRNDIPICELGMDEFEEESSLVTFTSRRPEKNLPLKEKVLEDSIHGGRRNDFPISELEMDTFEEQNSLVKLTSRRPEENLPLKEKVLEDSVHGGRRNDIPISEPENLGHGGRRNDTTTSELHTDTFEEKSCSVKLTSRRPEKHLSLPENSVHGGRRNDFPISDFENVKSQEQTDLLKLFEELDRFEEFSTAIKTGSDSDKVIGGLRKAEPIIPTIHFKTGSDVIDSNETDKMIKIAQNVSGESAIKVDRSSSWRSNSSSTHGSHGSMSEEKEWRRTLACKLFEERHNSRGGEEGMDSLWEAYETDNSKNNRKDAMVIGNGKKKMMMKMKSNNGGIDKDDDDDDDEDEDMSNGGLCCLQALKLSTGKMNLGMKKPNLLKISKALRGFGWLHHVKIKHGTSNTSVNQRPTDLASTTSMKWIKDEVSSQTKLSAKLCQSAMPM